MSIYSNFVSNGCIQQGNCSIFASTIYVKQSIYSSLYSNNLHHGMLTQALAPTFTCWCCRRCGWKRLIQTHSKNGSPCTFRSLWIQFQLGSTFEGRIGSFIYNSRPLRRFWIKIAQYDFLIFAGTGAFCKHILVGETIHQSRKVEMLRFWFQTKSDGPNIA